MTDPKAWIEERQAIHAAAPGETWDNYGTPPFEVYDMTEYDDGDMGEMLADSFSLPVAETVVDAHNNLPRALNALQAVLELHKPHKVRVHGEVQLYCLHCEDVGDWNEPRSVEHPCPTVQAIEGAINHA